VDSAKNAVELVLQLTVITENIGATRKNTSSEKFIKTSQIEQPQIFKNVL